MAGAAAALLTGGARAQAPPIPPGASQGERILDVHAHLIGRNPGDFSASADAAVKAMDQLGIARTLILPPPQPPSSRNQYDHDSFASALRPHAERFAFLGGGGMLNPLLQQYGRHDIVPDLARRTLETAADRLLAAGAVGFGEISAEHVSYEPNHPYESTPPDGPLMRLLADIAARRDVPIDFHMDAAQEDRPTPAALASRSSNNPKTIPANIARFERLLSHNRGARIVWAHGGRDPIGDWTVALSREMLRRHANLFISIALTPTLFALAANHPFGPGLSIKPEWTALLTDFPDRFVIGTDHFYAAPHLAGRRPGPTAAARRLINSLPAGIAARIARENAERIYKIRA